MDQNLQTKQVKCNKSNVTNYTNNNKRVVKYLLIKYLKSVSQSVSQFVSKTLNTKHFTLNTKTINTKQAHLFDICLYICMLPICRNRCHILSCSHTYGAAINNSTQSQNLNFLYQN